MIKIQELRKQDYKKARQFAIQGMHLYWYVSDKISLNLYARYFLDMELNCATRAYGAYMDGQFVGVLLAEIKGEPKKYRSVWRTAYMIKLTRKCFAPSAKRVRRTEKSFFLPLIPIVKSEGLVQRCFPPWKKMHTENLFISIQMMPALTNFTNTGDLSEKGSNRSNWI